MREVMDTIPESTVESGIEGKYILINDPEYSMEFNSPGTFFVSGFWGCFSGTYEVKGDMIPLIGSNGITITAKIEGNTIIDPDGDVWKKV